jgi:hypothetical protein
LEERKNTSKPKGVVPAYGFFYREKRERIREKNRNLDSDGVKKKCQEEWMALDHAGRKKYTDLHAEDKKRRTKETVAYLNNGDKNEDDEGA